jgi:hypothetical protein
LERKLVSRTHGGQCALTSSRPEEKLPNHGRDEIKGSGTICS